MLFAEEEPEHPPSHEEHGHDAGESAEVGQDANGSDPENVEHLSDLLDARLPESEERLRLSVSSEHPVTRDTHGFEEPTYIDLSLPPTGGVDRKSNIQKQTETDGNHTSVAESERVSHVNHFEGHDAANPHFDSDHQMVVTDSHSHPSETDENHEEFDQTTIVDGIHDNSHESENHELPHFDEHSGEDTHMDEIEHSVPNSHSLHELDSTVNHSSANPEDSHEEPIQNDAELSVAHSSSEVMHHADDGHESQIGHHTEQQVTAHTNEAHSEHHEDDSHPIGDEEPHHDATANHGVSGHESSDAHAEQVDSHVAGTDHHEGYDSLETQLHDATVSLIMSEVRGNEERIAESIQLVSVALQALIDKSAMDHSNASAKHLEKEAREMAIHIDRIDYALFQKDMRKVSVLVGKVARKVKALEHVIENMSEGSAQTMEEDPSSHDLHH